MLPQALAFLHVIDTPGVSSCPRRRATPAIPVGPIDVHGGVGTRTRADAIARVHGWPCGNGLRHRDRRRVHRLLALRACYRGGVPCAAAPRDVHRRRALVLEVVGGGEGGHGRCRRRFERVVVVARAVGGHDRREGFVVAASGEDD